MKAIVPTDVRSGPSESFFEPNPNDPVIGRWYWVTTKENGKTETWLGCVTKLGSNYAKMTSVGEGSVRIHFDRFHEKCKPEPNAKQIIAGEIENHRREVGKLMGKIEDVTKQLGVSMGNKALEHGETAALALRSEQSNAEIKSYKKALAKAKEKTLPELFEAIKKQNESMAVWMKADLIPLKAQAAGYKPAIGAIEQRIFNVELYAGLCEETEKVKDGAPASITEKLHLFQRRHYMDEECLANYEAGGMTFGHLKDFEEWLTRPDNFTRVFPRPRCIVAFRVRRDRYDWYRDVQNWRQFIQMSFEKEGRDDADRSTYLYIRNGEQLWRLETKIEFGAKLFPDVDKQNLLTGQLYAKKNGYDRVGDEFEDKFEVITQWEYEERRTEQARALWKYRAEMRAFRVEKKKVVAAYEAALATFEKAWDAWADKVDQQATKGKLTKEERKKRDCDDTWRFKFPGDVTTRTSATGTSTAIGVIHRQLMDSEPKKPEKKWVHEPSSPRSDIDEWKPWNKDSVLWDDIAKSVKNQIDRHNRLVLVLQGLFDRSLCLHPHPPIQLWNAQGFTDALQLVYDDSRALNPGEKPDFEAYRRQLNASLQVGSVTVGQDEFWVERETERYNNDARRSRRDRDNHYEKKRHRPEGNPGPGLLGRVVEISKRGKHATFRWQRKRAESNSWSYWERERQRRLMDIPIDCKIKVPVDRLLNVSAYTPGDFKRFYADPRTRAEYLRWAPYMLIAEDFWAGKRQVSELELSRRAKEKEVEVDSGMDTNDEGEDSDDE